MNANERFKTLIDYLITNKIVRNQQEFVENIDSDKATVSQIKNGKIDIPNSLFVKIKSAYPELNMEWLLEGEGDMIKTNNQISKNNSGIGIIGNNVNGGGINDNKIIQEMVEILKKKDEQIDKLLQIIQKEK